MLNQNYLSIPLRLGYVGDVAIKRRKQGDYRMFENPIMEKAILATLISLNLLLWISMALIVVDAINGGA